MTTPQSIVFPNSSSFSLSELLKIIQKAGIDPLWAEVEDGLEAVIKHESPDWGQEVRYALTVDAGGAAFGRIAQQGGRFMAGDKTRNILGKIYPKYQTFTYQFERFHQKLSKTQQQAYIENAKQEYMQKNAFQKSQSILQLMGDGTGRQGLPIGLGDSDAATGATFTISDNISPLKIKLSSLNTSAGGAAQFLEGSVISIVYIDRDPANGGADSVAASAATAYPRFLSLSCSDAGTGPVTAYDAFRVVLVDQSNDAIYVVPARVTGSAGDADGTTFVQTAEWCAGGSGVVTVTPVRGRRVEFVAVGTDTVFGGTIADLALVFNGETDHYAAIIHPNYVVQNAAAAKLQLGLGWTSTTEISTLNDGVFTGLETLLMNRSNTVHNISRSNVLQYLPSLKDNGGRDLTFNSFFAFISEHHNRNRGTVTDWNLMLMNPLVEASLISLSELDRRIVEGKGVRGEDGAKMIKMGGKNYQFESHSVMRKDRVFMLAKDAVTLHDGKIEDVEVGGQKEFLSIQGGARINVVEAYATVTGEMSVQGLRRCGAIHNFKASIL
jgi:hypothetical protein